MPPGVKELKLDGPTIANIFLGKITNWNDAAIAAQNKGVKLPDVEINVVHRTDGSGTTYIFTDYLSTVSPDWKSKVGKNTSVSWPAGLGAKGNEGVSGQIKQTPGSIGYVELIYALQNKLPYADVKNADGEYVKASLDSVTAALATATIPDDFRFSMVNAPGKTFLPHRGRDLAARLRTAEGRRQGQETRRVPQVGLQRRRENGQEPRLRPAARRRACQNGARAHRHHQVLVSVRVMTGGGRFWLPAPASSCHPVVPRCHVRPEANEARFPHAGCHFPVVLPGDGVRGPGSSCSSAMCSGAVRRTFSTSSAAKFLTESDLGPGFR